VAMVLMALAAPTVVVLALMLAAASVAGVDWGVVQALVPKSYRGRNVRVYGVPPGIVMAAHVTRTTVDR